MPRMQFSTIISRIKDITSISSSNKDNLIKDGIQAGLEEVTARDLSYLMENAVLSMVAPYTTGTVAITQGSTSVTGTGTTFTAAMVGRKIFIKGDENTYYIIASFTNATTITLDAPFVADTVTAATINIVKDRYKLPADLDSYKVFKQIKNKQSIVDIEPSAFDMFEPSPTSEGNPDFTILQGSELDEYTSGTVEATVNTSVITGTSTEWSSQEGLGRGSRVTIGSTVFTVKSVDSDTQLTVYENISSTISSGTSHIVHLDNLIIQFFQIPSEIELIRYKYQRLPFPLISDQDIPDLPEKWHHVLVTAGLIWAWATKDKDESARQVGIFNSQKQEVWKNLGSISKNRSIPRRPLDETIGFSILPPRFDDNIGRPHTLHR